jgi:hypothetical protein
MNEHKIQIISQLKEIADEYGLTFSSSDDDQFVYFWKYEVGMCDPAVCFYIDWHTNEASMLNLNKRFSLKDIKSYVILIAEVLS